MKRMFFLLISVTFFLLLIEKVEAKQAEPRMVINEKTVQTSDPVITVDDRMLVSIRLVSEKIGSNVQWNNENRLVTIITDNQDVLEMNTKNKNIKLNGRSYELDVNPIVKDNHVYVPIRLAGEVNHSKVDYINNTVSIKEIPVHIVKSGESLYSLSQEYNETPEDIMIRNGLGSDTIIKGQQIKTVIPYVMKMDKDRVKLLATIIEAEAQGESMVGKMAVGNVIMNRVKSGQFPNTIKEVIFQPNQFAPVTSGKIFRTVPSVDSILAAKRVLSGENVVGTSMYFYNPKKTSNPFFSKLTFVMQIENHRFMK